MNGKTKVSSMNPCEAEMDRNTWGFKWLNVCWRGKRWFKLSVLGVRWDWYPSRWWEEPEWTKRKPFFFARIRNAGILFHPLGCVTWPLPTRVTK